MLLHGDANYAHMTVGIEGRKSSKFVGTNISERHNYTNVLFLMTFNEMIQIKIINTFLQNLKGWFL